MANPEHIATLKKGPSVCMILRLFPRDLPI
jgi:hypothetical protein